MAMAFLVGGFSSVWLSRFIHVPHSAVVAFREWSLLWYCRCFRFSPPTKMRSSIDLRKRSEDRRSTDLISNHSFVGHSIEKSAYVIINQHFSKKSGIFLIIFQQKTP